MTIEQELKDRCTPEFIKWMCEYAEGFEVFYDEETDGFVDPFDNEYYIEDGLNKIESFPLLIHRAVEGWNKRDREGYYTIDTVSDSILIMKNKYPMPEPKNYRMKNYQPQNLTPAECACLHCLLDIFEEVEK